MVSQKDLSLNNLNANLINLMTYNSFFLNYKLDYNQTRVQFNYSGGRLHMFYAVLVE